MTKIEYKLLFNNKKGFLLSRTPEVLNENLIIKFTGSPNKATAIFENSNGNTLYRQLEDDTCSIPVEFIKDGTIKVAVTVLDGLHTSPTYNCETIICNKQIDSMIIYPEGADIEKLIVEVMSENNELKETQKKQSIKLQELEEKLNKMLDGYDFE